MTRGKAGHLQLFDIEIDRTFHRLARHFWNLSLESLPLDSVSLNNFEHSHFVSVNLNFMHIADSDLIHGEQYGSTSSSSPLREDS